VLRIEREREKPKLEFAIFDVFIYLIGMKRHINPLIEMSAALNFEVLQIYKLPYNTRSQSQYAVSTINIIEQIVSSSAYEALFNIRIPIIDEVRDALLLTIPECEQNFAREIAITDCAQFAHNEEVEPTYQVWEDWSTR